MDLSTTSQGKKHVLVFQDLFTVADGVHREDPGGRDCPPALRRRCQSSSHLIRDVCELLGMKKLNTTAYDPQCDGLVERYNSENMLHDLVCNGTPWDCIGLPQHST